MNFQIFKLVLEKAEKPEIRLPKSAGSSKKQESSRKTSISALLTMPKPLTVFSFSSIAQSCLTVCNPMNRSMPGLPDHHQLPDFTQIHVHRVLLIPHSCQGAPETKRWNPSKWRLCPDWQKACWQSQRADAASSSALKRSDLFMRDTD